MRERRISKVNPTAIGAIVAVVAIVAVAGFMLLPSGPSSVEPIGQVPNQGQVEQSQSNFTRRILLPESRDKLDPASPEGPDYTIIIANDTIGISSGASNSFAIMIPAGATNIQLKGEFTSFGTGDAPPNDDVRVILIDNYKAYLLELGYNEILDSNPYDNRLHGPDGVKLYDSGEVSQGNIISERLSPPVPISDQFRMYELHISNDLNVYARNVSKMLTITVILTYTLD